MFRFRIISSRYIDNYQIKAFKKDIKLASHIAKFRSFNRHLANLVEVSVDQFLLLNELNVGQ